MIRRKIMDPQLVVMIFIVSLLLVFIIECTKGR